MCIEALASKVSSSAQLPNALRMPALTSRAALTGFALSGSDEASSSGSSGDEDEAADVAPSVNGIKPGITGNSSDDRVRRRAVFPSSGEKALAAGKADSEDDEEMQEDNVQDEVSDEDDEVSEGSLQSACLEGCCKLSVVASMALSSKHQTTLNANA